MDNKNQKEFMESFEKTLKLCNLNIKSVKINDDNTYVTVTYNNNYQKKINISGNSNLAIIDDVVSRLY
jgi:hypothetical protein